MGLKVRKLRARKQSEIAIFPTSPRDDGGRWKCQLADTDASVVKAEALINLTVAFEAEVQVLVALEDEDGADAAPIVAFLGENITVGFDFLFSLFNRLPKSVPLCSCQVTDPNAFPERIGETNSSHLEVFLNSRFLQRLLPNSISRRRSTKNNLHAARYGHLLL